MPDLFTPIKVGLIEAKNRIFVAPTTRGRATKAGVPTDIMIEYYEKRSSAGVIITEAVGISPVGLGWAYAPGIYTDEHVAQWKRVTSAVHKRDGKIICQLWHMGRATHSDIIGQQPVSASATTYPTEIHTYEGKVEPEQARALTVEEIKQTVEDFGYAAKRALEAGFDGVQIHGANGYLVDQFLRDSSNLRTDEYGGSVENRVRFLDEVTAAVVKAAGPGRTSIRLSPNGDSQGVVDSNPRPLFAAAAKVLQKHGVSMIELRENTPGVSFLGPPTDQPKLHDEIRKNYKGVIVLNQGYTKETANKEIETGIADAISFSRFYMANPDLVEKFKNDIPLTVIPPNSSQAYSRGREGYLDF